MIGRAASALAAAWLTGIAAAPPDALERCAERLSTRPWSAEISVRVDQGSPEADPDSSTARFASHRVWFEPGGVVGLELGPLRIEARAGWFGAVHTANAGAIYEAEHEGLSLEGTLAAELPPLWSPWLAIAATGDADAWPRVGSSAGPVEWREPRGREGDIDPGTGDGDGERKGPPPRIFRGTHGRPGIGVSASVAGLSLTGYTVTFLDGPEPLVMDFTAEFAADAAPWRRIDPRGRVRVGSLAELMPPPPEIVEGDRLPALNLPCVTEGNLAVRRWRPTDAFDHIDHRRRPAALALVLVRADDNAAAQLAGAAEAVRRARQTIAAGEDAFALLARPIVATRTEDTEPGRLEPLLSKWLDSYRPDPTIAEAEQETPDLAWAPASMLLNRVAPAASAAIIVVDRAGWISAVLTGEATPEAIEAAARTAVE